MKTAKHILWLGLLLYTQAAQSEKARRAGIRFLDKDWKSVLATAKKLHKPVFVDAYTSWCAPCQEMKHVTFKESRLASYFNAHYLNVAIDVEKGAGVAFADHYQVNTYPTLLFIDANGHVLKRIEGFTDAKQLGAAAAGVK